MMAELWAVLHVSAAKNMVKKWKFNMLTILNKVSFSASFDNKDNQHRNYIVGKIAWLIRF